LPVSAPRFFSSPATWIPRLEFLDVGIEIATLAFADPDVQAAAAQLSRNWLTPVAVDLVEVEQFLDSGHESPAAAARSSQPRAGRRRVQSGQPYAGD